MEGLSLLKEYAASHEKIESCIIQYLDDDSSTDANFEKLKLALEEKKYREDKIELQMLLYLISNLTCNRRRSAALYNKIEKLLQLYQNEIKQFISNLNLFYIFKKDKRLLLLLFENKMLIPDETIFTIIKNDIYKKYKYPEYFYPEFKDFFDENYENKPDFESPLFDQNRKIGENDDPLCQIVRKDSVDEFISYTKEKGIEINNCFPKYSIFETNYYLQQSSMPLICYACFFGAMKIVKYMIENGKKLSSYYYNFAYFSQNIEFIQFLDEKVKISVSDLESIIKYRLNKSIDYFVNKFKVDLGQYPNELIQNYYFSEICKIESKLENSNVFFLACQAGYFNIVEALLKTNTININEIINVVFKYRFFMEF